MNPQSVPVALACRGVAKTYRSICQKPVAALNGIDVSIPKGSICALLGPNGAGKSTLFKVISGLTRPDEGEVEIGSQEHGRSGRLRLAYSGEGDRFPPQLTILEMLLWFAHWSGCSGKIAKEKTERVMLQLGLRTVQHRRFHDCSRGMRQRLGLGVCLAQDPDILLLDEPATGLDPVGWQAFLHLLEGIRMAGKTILFSSHQLNQLEPLCDYVVILHRGRILIQGHPRELMGSLPGIRTLEGVYLHHLYSFVS